MTSAAILPKVDLFSNKLYDNKQSDNEHMLVLSLSSKSVSGNNIFSGKTNKSAPCMIPKLVFIEEIDDDGQ